MLNRVNYTLTQLEYVSAVYKLGHFAKAAESCHVTQPTLSMQIQKFESDLGVIIFDRSKKPVILTDMGKKIIEQVNSILNEAQKMESLIKATQSERLEGHLILGVIPTIAPYLLPRLLPILEKSYPGMDLRIMEMQTQRIISALNNDEIDAGLLATPLKQSQIHELPLFYESFSVLCKKDHELSHSKRVKYSHLKLDDLWLLEEGHCLRNQMLDVCSLKKNKKFKKKYEFESGSLETLKSLVSSYGGYTLVPALAADSIKSNTLLIPFERPIPAREIGLVYRREHYKKDLIEALGQGIIKSIPEEVRKIKPKDLDVLPIEAK